MRMFLTKIKTITLYFILLISVSILYGEDIHIKCYVNKNPVELGEKIVYTIEVKYPKDYIIKMPSFGENLKDFVIIDFKEVPPTKIGNHYLQKQIYTLDMYLIGKYTIPAPVIRWKAKGLKRFRKKKGKEVQIEVKGIKPGKITDIKDIKGPVEIKRPFNPLYVIIPLIILGIGGIIFAFIIRKKASFTPPPIPAHIQAIQQIEELKTFPVNSEEQIKEFYANISLTVRRYIEARFKINAPDKTTEEFLRDAKEKKLLPSKEYMNLLERFLEESDMVKFAKYVPEDNFKERIISSAIKFIEGTKDDTSRT